MTSVRLWLDSARRVVPDVHGKRDQGRSSGPPLPRGWEIYHVNCSADRPESAFTPHRATVVWPAHPAIQRRGQNLGAGSNRVRLRRLYPYPTVGFTTGHAATLGVHTGWHLEPSADRSRTGVLRRRRGTPVLFLSRCRPDLAGVRRPARTMVRSRRGKAWAVGGTCACHTIHPGSDRPERPPPPSFVASRRRGSLPPGATTRHDLAPNQSRLSPNGHPRP